MLTYMKDEKTGKVLKYSEITETDVTILKKDIERQIYRIARSATRAKIENDKLEELNSALKTLEDLGLK